MAPTFLLQITIKMKGPQDLVPSVGQAGKAPMAAIHAGVVTTVARRVTVLPQLWHERYV